VVFKKHKKLSSQPSLSPLNYYILVGG